MTSSRNKESYLALLRGINVGGRNIIKMADLRHCFDTMGFTDVGTYIQSGNVVFKSDSHDPVALTQQIEGRLSEVFDYSSTVILVAREQLLSVVNNAPEPFGDDPESFRYDVLFLKPSLNSKTTLDSLSIKKGVDNAWQGDGVVYHSRLKERAGSSHLSKIVSHPHYKNITIRNWNTTTKLYDLMGE